MVDERRFDLQAHRGGMGLTVENTIPAFETALDLGVSTLECDVHISADGVPMVTHDRRVHPGKCRDTAPARPEDPDFPYVGTFVRRLTFAQLRTLDCGSSRHPLHPRQELEPGATMPTLQEVYALVRRRAADVHVNVETKYEAVSPDQTAPRERFVEVVAAVTEDAGMCDRVSVQSFDWGILMRMRKRQPRIAVNALTTGHHLDLGRPGRSPWLGGIDIDDFDGDLVAAAASFGADAVSPIHGEPRYARFGDRGYVAFVTERLVAAAHLRGMRVLPFTVNDARTARHLLALGVDGVITDYPDMMRAVLREEGMVLPAPYPEPVPA